MVEKQTNPTYLKQKLNSKLEKIDELINAIYECKIRLNSVKPLNYFQNETKESMVEILRNQARMSQILRSLIKRAYKSKQKHF